MSFKDGTCGIYKITNIINNKMYVGYSYNCEDRKNHHFKRLRKNIHTNPHLQSAWIKYGETNFLFEIIEKCDTEDTKIKMSLSKKGKPTGRKGERMNDEIKNKIKNSLMGRKHSQESKDKMKLIWKQRKEKNI